MTQSFTITLNNEKVTASADETIWQIAQREGIEIPHLCYSAKADYESDGNCRACMVEIEGERTLAASCIRKAQPNMVVNSVSDRAENARKMVFELLLADQPARDQSHNHDAPLWQWADAIGMEQPRFDGKQTPACDISHPAMAVNLDACINCTLCVRACRDVQVNDVIGMGYRGKHAKVIFDFDDEMGESTCVACGECVQACPTGALMPKTMLDDKQVYQGKADKVVASLCPYCGVGCRTDIHVKDNKIVKVDGRMGPANRNRLCVKGRFGLDYASHPQRLTKPLIRKTDVPKKWDDQIDPSNPYTHFREASWEEALELTGKKFKDILKQNGKDADGIGALAGFGSAKGSNEEAYLFQKLIRTGFGTNNVDHCTRLCHASSVAALVEGIGSSAVTAPFTAALDSDCIIVIGARPTENHPVAATFFKNAVKQGKRLIVLDPRGQGLVRHAWRHLQFKGGTDVALLNAMIHTIINEDLVDHDYISRMCDDYQAIKENIQQFSPEKMSEICNIDAESIREVARAYATSKRGIIFWGMGISQHVHGTDNNRCLITLAVITGHIGRKGTGLHPLRGQNNVQGASDVGLIPMMYPEYQLVEDEAIRLKFEKFWNTKLDPKRGLTVVETIDAILAGKVKGMYIMGENPAMSDPDTTHARKALAKLEHLVVQEIFLTETAYHADIILPASSFAEKTGSFTNTNRQVQLARPALHLPEGVKQDWEITQAIAQQIGLDWNYQHVSDIYNELQQVMPTLKGISWERLERDDFVAYPCNREESSGTAILCNDGFSTESGKARLVPTSIVPPDEVPDTDYPYILTTGRVLEHWHTGAMTRRATVLDQLEPAAIAHLNPRELRKLGIDSGAKVQVSTRRGILEIIARADRDVADGMVFIPFCFAESPANMLTNPKLDPYGKIPEFKFCAANVIAA